MFSPIGSLDLKKTIHIIGAGYSGLILGYFLKKNGYQVKIFEREKKVGGKIQTLQGALGRAETGAHAFFANDEIIQEFQHLGLDHLKAQKRLSKKILLDGKINAIAIPKREIFRLIWNIVFKRPPHITNETSVDQFFRPLLGDFMADNILPAAFLGIYALSPTELNFKSLFDTRRQYSSYLQFLFQVRRKKGFHSISFPQGMNQLIIALRDYLADELITDSHLTSVPSNSIICTDAIDAAKILEDSKPEASSLLKGITYQRLSSVTVLSQHEISEMKSAFGILNPTINGSILGVINNYGIFPAQQRNSHFSYTFVMREDKELIAKLQHDLKNIWGLGHLMEVKHEILYHPWTRGIPHYNHARLHAIDQLKQLAWHELALFGNYIGGISLREIFFAAKRFVER